MAKFIASLHCTISVLREYVYLLLGRAALGEYSVDGFALCRRAKVTSWVAVLHRETLARNCLATGSLLAGQLRRMNEATRKRALRNRRAGHRNERRACLVSPARASSRAARLDHEELLR